jgi:hypothetical protein
MDVSAYNLLHDFRISGHWWLPAKAERKIAGTLTVNPDAGVRLELVGRFDSPEFDALGMFSSDAPLEIVLGADADGKVYTLHNAAYVANIRHKHIPGFIFACRKAFPHSKGNCF